MSIQNVCGGRVSEIEKKGWGASCNVGLFVGALVILAIAGVATAASSVPGNAGGPATQALRETVLQITRLLDDPSLKGPEKAEERSQRIEKVAANRIAYPEMAKRTLGAQWQGLTETEREEFVGLFRRLLTKTYVHRIEAYNQEQIQYLSERVTADFVEVRTRIVSDKVEIPVDYRLLQIDGQWRVYDVVVEGVGLVNNYRGQFARIIRSSSYAGLVEQLRAKVGQDQLISRASGSAEK